MTTTLTQLSPDLFAATQVLAESLRACAPFAALDQARTQLADDAAAQTALADLSAAQAQLRRREAVTAELIAHARQLQADVRDNAIIQQLSASQQAATQLLRGVNEEISGLLGTDFAALGRRPGCC